MYVDIHAHAFHPKIAYKAVQQLVSHYDMPPAGTGLAEDLIFHEKSAGIDRAVVLCAATTASQVKPAVDFAIELKESYYDFLEPFGTLHPADLNWEEHLNTIKSAGLKGIKLHPDFQGFFLDDARLFPFFEEIGEDLLVICHIGDKVEPHLNPSCPYKLDFLRKKFPKVRFIAAHFGGYLHWEHALKTYIGKPVYIETSSAISLMPLELRKEIFQTHPMDYILFGSDYPIFNPKTERETLMLCEELTNRQQEQILTNGARALGYE